MKGRKSRRKCGDMKRRKGVGEGRKKEEKRNELEEEVKEEERER